MILQPCTYLGQGKCVLSFLFDGMIKFIGPLETSWVPGIKVDAMEEHSQGLGPPGGGGLVLCFCLVQTTSAANGQVGESILHVLIVDVEKTFLFSFGMKELVGKDADLQLVPFVCKEYMDVHVDRYGMCIGTFLKGIV